MKKLLIYTLSLALLSIFGLNKTLGTPPYLLKNSAITSTTACTIPDTVLYEAEHGTKVGSGLTNIQRTNASNDTNVNNINYTNKGVQFIMLYDADAIKLCHSGYQTGTYGLKINGVASGLFSITSSGGWNNIREAQLNVTVHAGDTVFIYSPGAGGAVIEMDCIKAYKAPNKKPAITITNPTAYDTVSFFDITSIAATVNDTDGTIDSVKFYVFDDSLYMDYAAPYGFSYTPKSFGHKSIVVTAYDNCGDSTVTNTQVFFVENSLINTVKYEAERGEKIGAGVITAYRTGASNDSTVSLINYNEKGVRFIMGHDADGIIIGYGTWQTGKYSLRVNSTLAGKFGILKTFDYGNVYQSSVETPIHAGDTVFVFLKSGDAYLEMDYILAYTNNNIAPTISLTNPGHLDTLYLDSTYTLTANAADTDGVIDSVVFKVNGQKINTDVSAPYEYNYLANSAGFKHIVATAFDNAGDSAVSFTHTVLVRSVIPDTILYQAEHAILSGDSLVRIRRVGASNDTTVTKLYSTGNNRVHFITKYPATTVTFGYGGYQNGVYSSKVNGVDSVKFTIYSPGGYEKRGEAKANIVAAAGDTITVWTKPVDAVVEADYLKVYNANGFVSLQNLYVPENEDWEYPVATVAAGSTIRQDTLDWDKFKIINDTLIVTNYSFDYEAKNSYFFLLDTNTAWALYKVNITNVSGNFDTNGPADSAVAAKYAGVNVGDYIYWNSTYHNPERIYDLSKISVDYPNKILIHAKKYGYVTIDLDNAEGNSASEKIVVTNFLGQVETQDGFSPQNVYAVRITGRYDSANGYGHHKFIGWDGGYEFRHGTFGFFANNRWKSENIHGINLNTVTDKVEIDFIEAGNGGFTGISWKKDNAAYTITDSSTVHHCFIHDVGSEGLYVGSTQAGQQQVFRNFTVENNTFLRCGGEGVQLGWQMGGCLARNNVIHSGLDWKFPFQPYQDGIIQLSTIGGNATLENNILMGGGEQLGLVEVKRNPTPYGITEDTIFFRNSLVYGIRAGMLVHLVKYDTITNTDSITHIVFDGNYYKAIGNDDYYETNLVSGTLDTANTAIFDIRTTHNEKKVRNCFYDHSVNNLLRAGYQVPDTTSNLKQEIPYPQFRNYLGLPDSFDYRNMSRYTDSIKKYQPSDTIPASWEVGDVVQHKNDSGDTRFYLCVQATSVAANRPSSDDTDNAYWQLLTWEKADNTISFMPPDDVRLDESSFFDNLGMGIEDLEAPGSLIANNRADMAETAPNEGATATASETATETKTPLLVNAYPNPAGHTLNITSNMPMQSIAIYDILGKQCLIANQTGASASIDLQKLVNGLYVVRIYSANGQTTVKQIQVLK